MGGKPGKYVSEIARNEIFLKLKKRGGGEITQKKIDLTIQKHLCLKTSKKLERQFVYRGKYLQQIW